MFLVEEIRVHSWNELNDALYSESWQEPLGRFRSTYVFRGQSDASHVLKTSLARMSGPESAGTLEGHLLRAFRRYAHRYAHGDDTVWNWLALAQHHGLPTRLLDWTYSPFVALHFATAEPAHSDRDGAVWCVNYVRTNESLPPALSELREAEGADVFTAEMLARAATTLPEYDALSDEPFIAFFEPPSLDERIVNQFALFSLLSDPATAADEWLEARNEECREGAGLYRRIVISADLKREARDKLDQANITERVLLPGLDGLSAWLRRYYTPGNGMPSDAAR